MTTFTLHLDTAPSDDSVESIRTGLRRFNITTVPELLNLPGDDFNVLAFDAHGNIAGGAIAEADLGWLFVDTLWVDERVRQQGYGRRILNAVEQLALHQGMKDIWLMTTDFQALPFYQKMGYRVVGQNVDRPIGHRLYYLIKTAVAPALYDKTLVIEQPPRPETTAYLNRQLIASSAVPLTPRRLAIFVKAAWGDIMGGLAGNAFWNWFDLRYLWLDERLRGQGFGAKLLRMLDTEGRRRGLRGIAADMLDWQALPFYEKHGFTVNFTLPNRPPGHTAYFIQKYLS